MEELLVRINELANKSKVCDLSQEELKEQKELRQEYLKLFKAGLRQQLDNTKIKELDGTIIPLEKKKMC